MLGYVKLGLEPLGGLKIGKLAALGVMVWEYHYPESYNYSYHYSDSKTTTTYHQWPCLKKLKLFVITL